MSPSRRPGNMWVWWRGGNGERGRVGDGARGCAGAGRGVQSHAPRRWRGGAMGTSRPTATGPHHGIREETPRDRTMGHARPHHGTRETAPRDTRGSATGPHHGARGARAVRGEGRAGGGERGVLGASYQKRKVLQKKISFCIVSEKRFAFHFSIIRRFSCYG